MSRITAPAFGLALLVACLWSVSMVFRDAAQPEGNELALARSAKQQSTTPARTTSAPIERTVPAPPAREEVVTPLDFDQSIDRLVAIGMELGEVIARGGETPARALNQDALDLLIAIGNAFPDAGERSLGHIIGLPEVDGSIDQQIRREVLQRVLRDDLDRRHSRAEKGGPRAGLDALVEGMLRLVPKDPASAMMLGSEMLVDAPYLGPSHESGVLDILELSRADTWLTDTATELLRTLWRNLERSGSRSRGDIASLALLFFDDPNPAHRLAALREMVRDPRLRRLAVDRATGTANADLAAAIGNAAAAELDAATALSVVRELRELGGTRMLGPTVLVGARDPKVVRRAYEEALGDGRDAPLRADLVLAGSMSDDGAGLELARIALREDPDPIVRNRALMALTANVDPSIGEQALRDALDDPVLGGAAETVRWGIAGLQNLATRGDANAVARIGNRLAIHPLLDETERAEVRAIVARATSGMRR